MPESVINTKIRMTTEGTDAAVKQYSALNDQAAATAASIQQADAASKSLNSTIAQTPDMPSQSAAIVQGVKAQAAALGDSVKGVAGKLQEAGEAGEQLSSVLDSLVPGLGGIFQSLTSLNPLAIAGTVAITGLTLAFGEMQKSAEAARAASEAVAKAQTEQVLAELDIGQRVILANEGNKAAREAIIQDLAANVAKGTELSAEFVDNETKLLATRKNMADALDVVFGSGFGQDEKLAAAKVYDQGKIDIETYTKAIEDQKPAIKASVEENKLLNAAAKGVNITMAEQSAVMKAVTQGADGANAALDALWNTTNDGPKILQDAAQRFGEVFKGVGQDIIKFAEKTADDAAKAAEKAAKEREDSESRLLDINSKLAAVESDRGKALADQFIEQQRTAQLGVLETKLAAAQAYDQAREKNKKIADIQQQGQAADIIAQEKFMGDQQKLLASYLKSETQATEDYSRERVRKLEDLYNTLNNLASQRDVAGFVNARRSGMTDIGRGDEDAGTAARRRREQYDQSAQEQSAAYAKENATRQAQLQQKLQMEAQSGQQEVSMASRVQKQIADLRAQYAAQDLRARRMSEETTYRQTVDILQRKRMDELKITAGSAAAVISIFGKARDTLLKFASGLNQGAARTIPSYDVGTPYLPQTGLILAHKGERIMTAAENAQYMRGGSKGGMGNVTINMSVGEIATPSQVADVERRIVNAIVSFAGNGNN